MTTSFLLTRFDGAAVNDLNKVFDKDEEPGPHDDISTLPLTRLIGTYELEKLKHEFIILILNVQSTRVNI